MYGFAIFQILSVSEWHVVGAISGFTYHFITVCAIMAVVFVQSFPFYFHDHHPHEGDDDHWRGAYQSWEAESGGPGRLRKYIPLRRTRCQSSAYL